MNLVKFLAALPAAALPAMASAASLNGSELSIVWAIPFAGILLSIALFPLFLPHFWHQNYGKVAVFWALCCVIPVLYVYGAGVAAASVAHAIIGDYVPFLLFVGALFVAAGGIHIRGSFVGKPIVNAGFLLVGAVLANLMGTTGAAMLLIRPLIAANEKRRYKMHTFIFFIFIVANIGGCLTPLGDPPLFMGFLRGVPFFWTTGHLILPLIFVLAILMAIYLAVDTYFFNKDKREGNFVEQTQEKTKFAIEGNINLLWLVCIVCAVLMSGIWNSGITFNVLSVELTPAGHRARRALPCDRRAVADDDAQSRTHCQSVHLRADRRSRQALFRHLRVHGARA